MAFTDDQIETFKRGECPGCGSPIERFAHARSIRHYLPDAIVNIHGIGPSSATRITRGQYKMAGGEPAGTGAELRGTDRRLCPWTTDDLYSLQLVSGWREGKSMLNDADYVS